MTHRVDQYTWAYWPMDEARSFSQNYSSSFDSVDNRHWGQLTSSLRPLIQGGPTSTQNSRWFDGVDDYLIINGDEQTRQMMTASFTIESWIWVEQLNTTNTVINYGGLIGDVDGSENYMARLSVGSTGLLTLFWEFGTGTNASSTQTGAGAVTLRRWTHVACVVTTSAGGATRDVAFYIDGAYQSGSAATNTAGGQRASWWLGIENPTTNPLSGAISDTRVSSIARTATEITQSAMRADRMHPIDSASYAVWRFSEAPAMADQSGNGYHLAPTNLDSPALARDPLINDGGFAKFVSASNFYRLPYRRAPIDLLSGAVSWTFNGWYRMNVMSGSAGRGLIGMFSGGETSDTNFLLDLQFTNAPTGDQFLIFHESGSGVNITTSTSDLTTTVTRFDAHMVTVSKQDLGNTTSLFKVYLDGSLKHTATLGNATGGSSDILRLFDADGATHFQGTFDDFSLSSIARSDAYVLDEYQRGIAAKRYFAKRGYNPSTQLFEYWTTSRREDSAPSGNSLIDVTVVSETVA